MINNKHRGFSIYSVPRYILRSLSLLIKVVAFFVIIISILTLSESVGQTFNPKVEIDAYSATDRINEDMYGYSTSSEYAYNPSLISALRAYPVDSLRITAPKNAGKRFVAKVDKGVYTILASDNTSYQAFTQYSVRIDVDNSNIDVYIDNQKIFHTTDSQFLTGDVGLFSSYNQEVYFDNVEMYNGNGERIFFDDFNSGASPAWNHDGYPSWFDNGTWTTVDGKYTHVGQQSLAIKKINGFGLSHYSIRAQITPASSSAYEQGFVGISFNHQDPLSGYRFMWQGDLPHPYSSNNPWETVDVEGQVRTATDLNLQPQVLVNLRGTPDDAARLVYDYNISKNLNVTYFELGNEIWSFGDNHMPSSTYAHQIKEYSEKMKAVDPKIKVGASLLVGFSDWDINVIKEAHQYLDFVVLHYYPPTISGSHTSDLQLLASPFSFGNAFKSSYNSGTVGQIEQTKQLLTTYASSDANRIEVLITEFNTRDSARGKDLVFGLTAADMIGQSIEHGAERLQFHALQNSDSHWHPFTSNYTPRPSALALSLFTEHFGDTVLSVNQRDIPIYSTNEIDSMPAIQNVPYISLYASKNANDSKMYIAAINKHELASMNTTISINNADVRNNAKTYTLNGASFSSNNEDGTNVSITEGSINSASTQFTYSFPPHSATIIELDVLVKAPTTVTETPIQQTETSTTHQIFTPITTDYSNSASVQTGTNEPVIAAAALKGGNPHVRLYDRNGIATGLQFFAFDGKFRGGVDVALADVNGDGKNDIITGAGPGGGPQVRIFDHTGKEIFNFFPFHPSYRGGVNVAGGDINGDGKAEVIVSQKSNGQAWVKAYKAEKGAPVVTTFNAFGETESGADVAVGDVDRDGKGEIIVGAGRGGGPLIRVYDEDGRVKPIQFFAFHPDYRGGISVSAGDMDGDGKDEIVAAQSGAEQAWVKVYRFNNEKTVLGSWKAFGDFEVGGNVGAADLDNDGKDEIIVGAGLGGGPQVRGFKASGKPLSTNFFVFDKKFKGGVSVSGN